MRGIAALALAAVLAGCSTSATVREEGLSAWQRLQIAAEIARIYYTVPMKVDIVVEEMFEVPGRPDLALARCRYGDLAQGDVLLVRHDAEPFEILGFYGGEQYEQTFVTTVDRDPLGALFTLETRTGRGALIGAETWRILPDDSVQPVSPIEARLR